MANTILGILTTVLLALSAFIAFKNKEAYANEIKNRQNEQKKLDGSRERLGKAKDSLAKTQKEVSETKTETAKLRDDEAAQKKANDGITTDIASKETEAKDTKTKLDGIQAKLKEIGNIEELVPKVKAIVVAIEDAKQKIQEGTTSVAAKTAEVNRLESLVKRLGDENGMVASKESYFKSTRISNVYGSWGFVTLGAGSAAGVVSGSTLEVVRDGQPIGKLLVSAVENHSSSASIVPDSLAKDTVLMAGDKVVPVAKPVAPAPKPAAKPAAAPEGAPEATPEGAPAEKPAEPDPFGGAGEKPAAPADKPAEPDPFGEPAAPAEKGT